MTIDLHCHWIPPTLAARLRLRSEHPNIVIQSNAERFVSYQNDFAYGARISDLDARLVHMDEHGIAMQVLSLAGLFGIDSLAAAECLPLVHCFNDALAAATRCHPTRFRGLASLPVTDIALACRELERAHGAGLIGAILPADGFTSLAAARRFEPIFATAQRLRCHLFIHPGPTEPQARLANPILRLDNARQRVITLEAQATLSAVSVTLFLTDFLDAFADVSVQIANLGGAIPFLIERMDSVCAAQTPGEIMPSTRLRRCYVDTSSFGPRAIELAVRSLGADRVVFGTDCPIFDTGATAAAVRNARLTAPERELIFAGNARTILSNLEVQR